MRCALPGANASIKTLSCLRADVLEVSLHLRRTLHTTERAVPRDDYFGVEVDDLVEAPKPVFERTDPTHRRAEAEDHIPGEQDTLGGHPDDCVADGVTGTDMNELHFEIPDLQLHTIVEQCGRWKEFDPCEVVVLIELLAGNGNPIREWSVKYYDWSQDRYITFTTHSNKKEKLWFGDNNILIIEQAN